MDTSVPDELFDVFGLSGAWLSEYSSEWAGSWPAARYRLLPNEAAVPSATGGDSRVGWGFARTLCT